MLFSDSSTINTHPSMELIRGFRDSIIFLQRIFERRIDKEKNF